MLHTVREAADLDGFIRDAESVATQTYQRSLGVGFLADERQRARTRMLMDRGWFRSYVLYLDERPVAFEQGEAYRSRFSCIAAGYDPALRQHRIGGYLLTKVIEDLVGDPSIALSTSALATPSTSASSDTRASPKAISSSTRGDHGRSGSIWPEPERLQFRTGSRRSPSLKLLDRTKQWWRRRHLANGETSET